jgi:hypothetical protein
MKSTNKTRNSPDRFLFGTDSAAPADQSKYLKVFYQYDA